MAREIHVFRTPDRFVAGTVGQPGNRTFYLQAVHDKRVISVILEKQQVAVLAERIAALLLEINRRFGTPIPPETGEVEDLSPLITPVDAEFRVGTMGLGWDSEAQTVVVELLAVSETEFDASVVLDDAEEGPDAVRVFLTPESARQFATRLVDGIEPNEERMRTLAESSPSIVTPLNSAIGYENAAKIAKHAVKEGITIRQATIDLGFVDGEKLTEVELDRRLDVLSMANTDRN